MSVDIVITASNTNSAPLANAGPDQNVIVGAIVTLDGSASSDPNGAPLTFAWSITGRPPGIVVALSDPTSARPTFRADLGGIYIATVVVNNGLVSSSAASTVTVTASAANAAPVANAGAAQSVTTGTTVTLNGSASSDANGDALTYAWTLTSRPAGSAASLVGATSAAPTFTADVGGTYVASLVVNDGTVSSAASTVTVTAGSFGAGKTYNVSATRIESNFYSIVGVGLGADTIIQTKFCFAFASSTNATLVMTGYTGISDGKITFANGTSCDVAGAYRPQALLPGSYAATLSFEEFSFFTDLFTNSIIRASSVCFTIRYVDRATLNLTYAGGVAYNGGFNIGSIIFADGSTCALTGIYGLVKLN